jgi:hypothetical protein
MPAFLRIVHHAWVVFIAVYGLLILAGGMLDWKIARILWLRIFHLLMIFVAVVEVTFGLECPLTILEKRFTVRNGGNPYDHGFVVDCIRRVLGLTVSQRFLNHFYQALFVLFILFLFWFPAV